MSAAVNPSRNIVNPSRSTAGSFWNAGDPFWSHNGPSWNLSGNQMSHTAAHARSDLTARDDAFWEVTGADNLAYSWPSTITSRPVRTEASNGLSPQQGRTAFYNLSPQTSVSPAQESTKRVLFEEDPVSLSRWHTSPATREATDSPAKAGETPERTSNVFAAEMSSFVAKHRISPFGTPQGIGNTSTWKRQ